MRTLLHTNISLVYRQERARTLLVSRAINIGTESGRNGIIRIYPLLEK